jgi:UDP-N-acetyl-D-mannosaminuronic acid dehydrogenase
VAIVGGCDEDADVLLAEVVKADLVKATTDTAVLEDASAVIVTIGTRVDENLDPSAGEFDRSMKRLLALVRPGQLLMLRNTIFPGMTGWSRAAWAGV